eukprot:g5118.t1
MSASSSKRGAADQLLEESAKRQRVGGAKSTKPILVVLPGSSSKLSADMKTLLMPALEDAGFDVRVRKGKGKGKFGVDSYDDGPDGQKWRGWDPEANAKHVVKELDICPSEIDAAPWFVLGCSFGARVACSIVADELTPVAPGLILCGYPMYAAPPKAKKSADSKEIKPKVKDIEQIEARITLIQQLPASAKVLAISGAKDEYLNKNAPAGAPQGAEPLWSRVLDGMACRENASVHVIDKGTHGCYEPGKSAPAIARKEQATANMVGWINDFAGNA